MRLAALPAPSGSPKLPRTAPSETFASEGTAAVAATPLAICRRRFLREMFIWLLHHKADSCRMDQTPAGSGERHGIGPRPHVVSGIYSEHRSPGTHHGCRCEPDSRSPGRTALGERHRAGESSYGCDRHSIVGNPSFADCDAGWCGGDCEVSGDDQSHIDSVA